MISDIYILFICLIVDYYYLSISWLISNYTDSDSSFRSVSITYSESLQSSARHNLNSFTILNIGCPAYYWLAPDLMSRGRTWCFDLFCGDFTDCFYFHIVLSFGSTSPHLHFFFPDFPGSRTFFAVVRVVLHWLNVVHVRVRRSRRIKIVRRIYDCAGHHLLARLHHAKVFLLLFSIVIYCIKSHSLCKPLYSIGSVLVKCFHFDMLEDLFCHFVLFSEEYILSYRLSNRPLFVNYLNLILSYPWTGNR